MLPLLAALLLAAPAPLAASDPPDQPAAAAVLTTPSSGQRAVDEARELLGRPYRWGGREEAAHPGVDCLGLLYLSWGPVTGTPWRAYPVNPSQIVAGGLLGEPVPGLDGVLATDLDLALLRPGDVIYLLMARYRIPDEPLWTHEGSPYWPWHTAMFTGDGRAIHAAPGGTVREEELMAIPFDAVFVTRR